MYYDSTGMHRTGLTMYLILRGLGYDENDTLSAIKKVREVTYKELLKSRRWFQNYDINTLIDFAETFIKYDN